MKKKTKSGLATSKMVYPIAVDFRMRPVSAKSRNYHFTYWEGFATKHEDVVRNTYVIMSRLAQQYGFTITRDDRDGLVGIQIAGQASRHQIGDMMTGEFMPWSTIAELPLRKIFEGATLNVIHA